MPALLIKILILVVVISGVIITQKVLQERDVKNPGGKHKKKD